MKSITVYFPLTILALGLLISFLLLEDWWLMIIINDIDYIDSYHFGSESMMAHGGWVYKNKELYAWSGFGIAIIGIIGFITGIISFIKKSRFLKQCTIWLCVLFIFSIIVF